MPVAQAQSQPLDCDLAFTRMELAICGSTSLTSQYRQFRQLAAQALADNALSTTSTRQLEDNLARVCRTAEPLEPCLEREITRVLTQIGGIRTTRAQGVVQESNRVLELRAQLAAAEQHYAQSGNPERKILSLLAILQYYEQTPHTPQALDQARAWRGKVLAGCYQPDQRRRWNQALQSLGWGCPLSYAANDLD